MCVCVRVCVSVREVQCVCVQEKFFYDLLSNTDDGVLSPISNSSAAHTIEGLSHCTRY